jgi:UDPglucose 6-dehydrogenase
MKVAVVGCGYVGLVSSVGLASVGHEVVGIEVTRGRREQIAAGEAPFHEPGLTELLQAALDAGTFRVSGELDDAADADVVLLAVQTPPTPEGRNDLSFLQAAARALADVFARDDRRRVVATRSTVVPGTAETVVAPAFAAAGVAERVAVASNPEFLREGSAVRDYLEPDRIVVGCADSWGVERMRELYAPFPAPFLPMSTAAAELAKYASNALLATLVSFSNEFARLCEALPGVDVEDVLGSVHLDRRFATGAQRPAEIVSYLRAGCGYGGSCLPKDLSAVIAHGADSAVDTPLLAAVRAINDGQPGHLLDRAEEAIGPLTGRAVAVLGLAFKGGTDDLRASPGLRVVDLLLERGARVLMHDPLVKEDALGAQTARGATVVGTLDEAVERADVCIVAGNAPEFARLVELVEAGTAVVDGRRALAAGDFDGLGFLAVGRGTSA